MNRVISPTVVQAFARFASQYRASSAFRASVGDDAADAMREIGVPIPSGVSVRLVADTDDVLHMVFPPDPNQDLTDEELAVNSGGSKASTLLSIGSAGTAATSTAASCLGTVSCTSTVDAT